MFSNYVLKQKPVFPGRAVYCLPHPSGANVATRQKLNMAKIIANLRQNLQK